jgi:prephenate dehydratase
MRIGYFGPEGTFTHEALLAVAGERDLELVGLPTIYDTVLAVHDGTVERALVPIENSLEGSVNATLDALAIETDEVAIVGELVHGIRQCLLVRAALELEQITTVVSHPQPLGQCTRFIRTRLPQATVLTAASTADAVRQVAERDEPWAALGNRLAAELYGCEILRADVEDVPGNETRFVWLALDRDHAEPLPVLPGDPPPRGPWKTAIVFYGLGSEAPGWLVRCLSELSERGVNLTRIESRPRKQGLGRYMFFADLEGRTTEPHVAGALAALRDHVEVLRVLGSFPAAG